MPAEVVVEMDACNPDTLLEQCGRHHIWVRRAAPEAEVHWPVFAYRGLPENVHAFLVDVYGMDPDEATELIQAEGNRFQ